jgi:hypothetical protein
MTGSVLLPNGSVRNWKFQSRIKSDEHTHLRWCEQLMKHKFPQCAPANLETSCLLEIGCVSWKLRLRCKFPWCARVPGQRWIPQLKDGGCNAAWSGQLRAPNYGAVLAGYNRRVSERNLSQFFVYHESRMKWREVETGIWAPELCSGLHGC